MLHVFLRNFNGNIIDSDGVGLLLWHLLIFVTRIYSAQRYEFLLTLSPRNGLTLHFILLDSLNRSKHFPMDLPHKRLVTDFTNLAAQKWMITNDGVMGGKSSSQFQINKDGNGVFIGTVSLENNGGFASVRNHEPINLTGFNSVYLRVRGDGNRYSFRLQTGVSGQVHPWSYEQRFDTPDDEWTEIDLPFGQFYPTYRGRTPEDAPPLDPANIMRYGFLISDKQEGDFRLEIEKIWVV